MLGLLYEQHRECCEQYLGPRFQSHVRNMGGRLHETPLLQVIVIAHQLLVPKDYLEHQ